VHREALVTGADPGSARERVEVDEDAVVLVGLDPLAGE